MVPGSSSSCSSMLGMDLRMLLCGCMGIEPATLSGQTSQEFEQGASCSPVYVLL